MADVVARQNTPVFLFLYPKEVTAKNAISVVVKTTTTFTALTPLDAVVYREIHTAVLLDSSPALRFEALPATTDVQTTEDIFVSRRTNRISFQARLGAKLDLIKRKLLDNSIILAAHPTDMLRVRVERDPRTQDIQSRRITANEVLPIMLPTMKDIPLRRVKRGGNNVITFSMADVDNSKPFEAYCPLHGRLHRDDLLFRFIKDPHSDLPYAMVLQVKDELGTIAYSSLLHVKYTLTFYDEPIPAEIVAAVYNATLKRERVGW